MADNTQTLLKQILTEQGQILSEQQTTNGRLSAIEARMEERLKICDLHKEQLTQHDKRIGKNEVAIGTLKGSWKTYMGISAMLGAFSGAVATWLKARGGG